MEKIKYYIDKTEGFLFAYEKSCEFFVQYIPTVKKWVPCDFSFSSFVHERDFAEIEKTDALKKAEGNSPEGAYTEYIDMIRKNLG